MNYYVVQVRTGLEDQFLELDKKINNDNEKEYKIIFPQRILKIRRAGIMKDENVPVFKGYVFIETEKYNEEIYRKIKLVKGFYRFLPSNEEPKPLHGRDLDLLNHFLGFGGVADISLVSFDMNDRIQIIKGPLKGLEGKIIKVNKRKGRAKVKLDMYQDSFSIDFAFEVLNLK